MRRPGSRVHGKCQIGTALALPACSLLIVLGPDSFPLITIRAFLLPGAVLLLMIGVLGAVARQTWIVDGAVLAALICSMPVFLLTKKADQCVNGPGSLCVTQMNVHQANDSFAGAVAAARADAADLLSVQEVDARWEAAFVEGLADLYPYTVSKTADDNYGIALFSRSPLENAAVFDLCGLPAIHATVRVNGLPVLVLAVHLRSPESPSDLKQRNLQWTALEHFVNKASGPILLVGDLNTLPWDDAAERFTARTSMAWGPQPFIPTWPSIATISLIPLDHVLTSPGLCIQRIRAFPIPGSDHRGLSASMAITP